MQETPALHQVFGVGPEPEKVHVLNPEEALDASNSKSAYTNPFRTAFYGQ